MAILKTKTIPPPPKNLLEKIVGNIQYDDLGDWRRDDLIRFSEKKKLFDYQIDALKNITKVLHEYFKGENGRRELGNRYRELGYELSDDDFDKINRICIWMATGSGKSLVIIKTIELLDYFQTLGLIPKRDILFLPPREDLIHQFEAEINDYNMGKGGYDAVKGSKKIDLIPLTEYDKSSLIPKEYDIKVYYCKSDLLKEERKENQLDYRSYLNHGNWYVFLDEAHRGKSNESLLKKYVNELCKNGFLFNFSATFTDKIDHLTTGYNFNLEKFTQAGFGKNIYLSKSHFQFDKKQDEFGEREKQKQVLKSLLVFTLIKQSKSRPELYHDPLMLTLVNTVNKNTVSDPDLVMFFQKLEEIANGKADKQLLNEAKGELKKEISGEISFLFTDEKVMIDDSRIENITIEDISNNLFNSNSSGKFEYLEGETGSEIILKMQTGDKPFGLIRIGDTKQFIKNYLSGRYEVIKNYQEKKFFHNLNDESDINLLMGSRAFYEGWDSNRPNVMNFINIGKGKGDDKKFLPQAIGRGIRIEPEKNNRKRLTLGNSDKNSLLETLFIFPTDVSTLQSIMENIEEQREKTESILLKNITENERRFDLLIPVYKEMEKSGERFAKFNISEESLNNFNNYYQPMSKETVLIKTDIALESLKILKNLKTPDNEKNKFFQIKNGTQNNYQNMDYLFGRVIRHLSLKSPRVSSIKKLENEIVHFKHIRVSHLSEEEIRSLEDSIEEVGTSKQQALSDEEKRAIEVLKTSNIQYKEKESNKKFKDLHIRKLINHFYVPIIYSEAEKIDYIQHVIHYSSEVNFLENLIAHIGKRQNSKFDFDWMFSKIDESLDKNIYIPYFYKTDNWYRNFYPDFIFWIKKDKQYKIIYIDPKSAKYADYEDKVDDFILLFRENDRAKVFQYKDFSITFDLKMITDDNNKPSGEKYRDIWIKNDDFSFLNM